MQEAGSEWQKQVGGGEKGEKGQGYLQHHALGTIYPW